MDEGERCGCARALLLLLDAGDVRGQHEPALSGGGGR